MSVTQPIRNISEIEKLKNYYYLEKPNLRNYTLICLGVNSALRISDLLELNWQDVYDFTKKHFLKHIVIRERKTGKQTQIALNQNARKALQIYKNSLQELRPSDFLFPGRTGANHLSRSQAFRVIKTAGQKLNFETDISCHSLRKTFGYHAWKSGAQPAVLMNIYNHSSFQTTKRYLGIEQDDKDQIFLDVNL
ncbi:MAG: tyrosine-type recombinase/integrase [Lachnospiraceae bacterium]|nr:tyrosine-type recombinase/integrase [Lachnospiraceae bacterium]